MSRSEGLDAEHGPQEVAEVTRFLKAAAAGDADAFNVAFRAMQARLHDAARALMRRHPGERLEQPTGLVHDAYVKGSASCAASGESALTTWRDREHFVASMIQVMRNLLVDGARRRAVERRSTDQLQMLLADMDIDPECPDDFMLFIDEAVTALASREPIAARLLEMRYFGGFTWSDAGEVLGLAVRERNKLRDTVRTWLAAQLGLGEQGAS